MLSERDLFKYYYNLDNIIILSLFAYCYQFFIVMKIAMSKMIPLRGVYSLLYLVNNLS